MLVQKDNANKIDIEQVFANFPNEEYWRMFIDTQYWSMGQYYFDRDSSPGYLQSVSRAFYYTLSTINQPLTEDLILGLHGIAYHMQDVSFVGKFVEQGRFRIGLKDITKDGLTELIEHIRLNKTPTQFLELFRPSNKDFTDEGTLKPEAYSKYPYMDPEDGHFKLDINKSSSELAELILDEMNKRGMMMISRTSSISSAMSQIANYIDTYYKEIIAAEDDQEKKLAAIVKLIHFMHVYHPFGDGNGRTFIFILLNKLLIMNGLSPTIVRDPAAFSCWSVNELVNEVKNGQILFKDVCNLLRETKTTKLSDYVREFANLNENEFLFNQAKVDLAGFFNKYDSDPMIKEFIDNNHDKLLQLMTERYSSQTIEAVMTRIKPDAEQIRQLIDLTTRTENVPLISYLIQYTQTQYPDVYQQLMSEDKIKDYLKFFNSLEGIKILQQLPIQNTQYFDILTNTSGIFAYNSSEQTFFNGMTAPDYGINHKGYIDYMLNQITPAQFMKLMSTDYNGINGAQLLTLFMENDKMINHVQRLDISKRWELISLLKSKITSENGDIIKNLSSRNEYIGKAIKDITQLSGEKLSPIKEVTHHNAKQQQSQKPDR